MAYITSLCRCYVLLSCSASAVPAVATSKVMFPLEGCGLVSHGVLTLPMRT